MQRPSDATIDPLTSIAAAAGWLGINKSTLARQVKIRVVRSHCGKVRKALRNIEWRKTRPFDCCGKHQVSERWRMASAVPCA